MIDCIVVGAGHNGLVTAAYLSRAGYRVLVLEAADRVGGAAISSEVFPGVPARLSKYSYLVSLLPPRIIDDLDIQVPLARRRFSSYTPDPSDPTRGLLIPTDDDRGLRERITAFTGRADQADAWISFYERTTRMAHILFPSLLEPLVSQEEMRARLGEQDWRDFIELPLGDVIERTFDDDVLRGIVLTDGLIGTFAGAQDASLHQNICFLYHVIGQGTGEWDVPVGGMGAITAQLAQRVQEAGGDILTSTEVVSVDVDDDVIEVTAVTDQGEQTWQARTVAAGCAPAVLDRLLGRAPAIIDDLAAGAQLKVNMLLSRFPKLRDTSVSPDEAFVGTFHINESYRQIHDAYAAASRHELPSPIPAEIYCHSLSDPSILSDELRAAGVQTLTLFGLHTPHAVFSGEDAPSRQQIIQAVEQTLDSVLAEPISDCLFLDPDGHPCIEVNTTVDLETDLRIPSGNIFHTPLGWPWALEAADIGSWGVETDVPSIALCGSGAARGGGVSGIPGHNAARYLASVLSTT